MIERKMSENVKKPTPDPKGRCGTAAGYHAHRRRGEKACDECRAAQSAANLARAHGKKPEKAPPAKPRRRHIPIEHKLEALEKGMNDPHPVEMTLESVEEAASDATPDTASATEPTKAAKPIKGPTKAAETPAKAPEVPNTLPAKQAPSKPPRPARPAKATAERKVPAGVPAPPDWLRARGLELWIEVNQAHKLNASALALLGEACRTADRLERLAAALSSRSTLWFELGDVDQATELGVPIVINGMISEARQLQTTLRQTLTTLKVVEVDAAEKVAKSPLDELAARRKKRLAGQGGA